MKKNILKLIAILFCNILVAFDAENVLFKTSVGYSQTFWDSEKVSVFISSNNGKIKCTYKKYIYNKMVSKRQFYISKAEYIALWEYIEKDKILQLRNAAWLNGSLNEEEFNYLYKKFPRKYSYIYEIYFNTNEREYIITVDDLGYVKDMRYLEVIKRINSLFNIKTEVNIFGDDSTQ